MVETNNTTCRGKSSNGNRTTEYHKLIFIIFGGILMIFSIGFGSTYLDTPADQIDPFVYFAITIIMSLSILLMSMGASASSQRKEILKIQETLDMHTQDIKKILEKLDATKSDPVTTKKTPV